MDVRNYIVELVKTCEACPSQWDARTPDGKYIYIRYRYGNLWMGVGDTEQDAVLNSEVTRQGIGNEHDGLMDTKRMLRLLNFKVIDKSHRKVFAYEKQCSRNFRKTLEMLASGINPFTGKEWEQDA